MSPLPLWERVRNIRDADVARVRGLHAGSAVAALETELFEFAKLPDCRDDTIQIFHNLFVGDTNHAKSLRAKPTIATLVVLGVEIMGDTVHLDDKAAIEAHKVGDEGANRTLAAELVFAKRSVAESHPKKLLAFGGLTPKVAGMFG